MPFHKIKVMFLVSYLINSIQSQSNIKTNNAEIATQASSNRDQKGKSL